MVVSWNGFKGISYEVDCRHVELVVEQFGLQDAKCVSTLGVREEGLTNEEHEEPLNEQETTRYRAAMARCNHLALDRPDSAYAVEEFARAMVNPKHGDVQRLQRLGRTRLQQWYCWRPSQDTIKTYSDADWAGCRESREPTTGGCVTIWTRNIKAWSRSQALIALSPGELEFYASVKAAAKTFGILSMANDFALKIRGYVWGDASAALGIINRTWPGTS